MAKGIYSRHVAGKTGATAQNQDAVTTTGFYLRQRALQILKKPATWITAGAVGVTSILGCLYKDNITNFFNNAFDYFRNTPPAATEPAGTIDDGFDNNTNTVVVETPIETQTETIEEPVQESFSDRLDDILIYDVHDDMVRDSWYKEPFYFKAESLAPEKREIAKQGIEAESRKYKKENLDLLINRIYVLDSMSAYGSPMGGTNHSISKCLYLVLHGFENSEFEFAQRFNHELPDLFYKYILSHKKEEYKDYFDEEAFRNANPEGFEYYFESGGSYETLEEKGLDSTDFNQDLSKDGFTSKYNQVSLRNDFSMIALQIFKSDPGFWEAYDKYEPLRIKTGIVMDSFAYWDPNFYTPEHFRKVSQE